MINLIEEHIYNITFTNDRTVTCKLLKISDYPTTGMTKDYTLERIGDISIAEARVWSIPENVLESLKIVDTNPNIVTELEYLNDPNKCPYCKSESIKEGDISANYKKIMIIKRQRFCNDCSKLWVETYTLSGVKI